ncbi:magnesium/cobalt transporter CorA [Nocardioides alcanivorans]|uniref:magnesium/cobalt transporter CorA n=1 Tax=Nocardioides alcanivorans TaxID=2897352 RepID=UPI001F1D67D1|nr:magnesium/cobalt transporter CorA [Nocardioides alcanivorans]
MIVDSALYHEGQRVSPASGPEDLASLRQRGAAPGSFLWVGLHDPTADELSQVAGAFDLHRLAVEDALKAHQRPKLERYGDSLFLVLKTLWYLDESDAVETGEVNIFLGRDFVITVRHGLGGSLGQIRSRLEQHPELLEHGPTAVTHAICDHAVDDYQRVVASLQDDVDEVEAGVFSPTRTDSSTRIYLLKREIAEVRRAVMPLRDPMQRAATGSVPGMAPDAAPFFRDVADHLVRVAESVDELDGLLSSAFAAQQTRSAAQQNDDMRKISAGVALVAVPTLIAGVYGMNFTKMPELHWGLGYPMSLGLMVASVVALLVYFKKSGWL